MICDYPLRIYNFVNSALSDYLTWRDDIFFSSGRDTSLLQMLPCWFPKAVRRLIQLYAQVSYCYSLCVTESFFCEIHTCADIDTHIS